MMYLPRHRHGLLVSLMLVAGVGGTGVSLGCSGSGDDGDPAKPGQSGGKGGAGGEGGAGGGQAGAAGNGGGGSGDPGGSSGGAVGSSGSPAEGGQGGAPAGQGGSGGVVPGDGGSAADSAAADASGPAAMVDGAPRGRKVLLVVGSENGTTERGEGIGDRFLRARLGQDLGHVVSLGNDNAGAASLRAAAEAADLVIVSESVSSAFLQAKLKPVATPIVNCEAFIQDEMGLTPPGPPGDPGEPDRFALGVKAAETRIEIVDPAHPLAAGLTGTVAVYKQPRQITWGKVAESARVVATLPGDPAGAAIYVYEKGSLLRDGTMAAGRRIGFFLEDDDQTGTANLMTDAGFSLIDAAIAYGLAEVD